jgi:hypothetical protein
MIKIAILGPWWDDAITPLKIYLKQTPDQKGVWEDMVGVNNLDEADYYVVMQADSKISKKLPKNKKIFLRREPDSIISEKKFRKNKGLYLASYNNEFNFVTWWVDKTYDQLKVAEMPSKSKNLNTVLSHKTKTNGQKLRTQFASDFLDKYPDSIDVYGSFIQARQGLKTDVHTKPALEKYACTVDYRYSFVAENSLLDNYFTEKIVDSYLSWAMPIYWGCPNLEEYFPKESFHRIDITDPSAVDKMYEISRHPLSKNNVDAIRHARHLILEKYNLWPAIYNIIKNKI